MTYMIPPVFSEDVKSSGERQIFEMLKDDPETDTWTCLHSLGLSKHVTSVYGEIDFVLLVPGEGIFCLEVKSGSVSRKDGVWKYTDKYGHGAEDTRGPFRQVSDAMFSLKNYIKEEFGTKSRLFKLLYGWAVIFPHCEFNKSGPDYENWQVYNKKDRERPISSFMRNLFKKTHEKMKDQRWYSPQQSRPTKKDISELLGFLRGDFEFCVKKGSAIKDLQDEILRLTEEQVRCLDNLRFNKRCFFTGAAGTGKTVLAVEFAKRQALSGSRVLFLCFNRLLSQKLNNELAGFRGRILVDTFHHYIDDQVSRSSFADEFKSENDKVFVHKSADSNVLFREVYPYFAELVIGEGREEPFDCLVLDEVQDLMLPSYLDVLDGFLKGGLNGGRWAFFGDLHSQRIFSDLTTEALTEEMDSRAPHHVKYSLMVNCRNTRNIGRDTCRLAGFDEPPYLPSTVTGPPVEYQYYSDPNEQPQILRKVIGELGSDGIQPSGITILSRYTLKKSCVGSIEKKLRFKIQDITLKDMPTPTSGSVNFSSIYAFKGLESPAIIITDVTDLESDKSRDLLYVAMSRAQLRLFMVLPETLRHQVNSLVRC